MTCPDCGSTNTGDWSLKDLVIVAFLAWGTTSLVWYVHTAILRSEAIEAGAAHWTIDDTTGERRFEWIGGEQ